jgi:hypothetical protein
MTNYVQTDHGIVQLSFTDIAGTLTASSFAGTATNGYSLQLVSGVPTWQSVSATNATNISGGAAGSLPYQTAASTTSFLAPTTNGYILTLVSGLPAWAAAPVGTSITGTANQVIASASTGAVTLSLPSSVSFQSSYEVLTYNSASYGSGANGVAGLIINNASSTMQSTLEFQQNGVVNGRVRSDYAGNMTYVTTGTGYHNFQVGGDSGVGTGAGTITSAGFNGAFNGTLNGYTTSLAATASTIAVRQAGGYLAATYFNQSSAYNENPPIGSFVVQNTSYDGYHRFATPAQAAAYLSGNTMNINGSSTSCSGNAASASVVAMAAARTDGTAYPVVWGTTGATSQLYSCTNVNIQSSTGTLNATILNATSDANRKKNITTIVNGLEIVEGLNGVKFNWIDNNTASAGLIAQDVEQFLPELVTTNEETGIKALNYNGVIGALVEAVKTLSAQVKALQLEVGNSKQS